MLDDSFLNENFISKYSVKGPRYTSYPTAVEFSDKVDNEVWKRELLKDYESKDPFSLYFHVPYCRSLCYFCACNKVITQDTSVSDPYLDVLFSEMKNISELVDTSETVEQIHWGGGTPNFLSSSQIEKLHNQTLKTFPKLSSGGDVSVEIDPRTISFEQIKVFKDLGFKRISLGVQDFDPQVQETINRIQPYDLTRKVCDQIREVAIEGINFDLIYGLPNQTIECFEKTVDQVLEIKPNRIALYGYAHVTWINKAQNSFNKFHLPTPIERIRIFIVALKKLLQAGYVYIGLDHFALPDDTLSLALKNGNLNRNFMGYTAHRGTRLIGFGASSISTISSAYAQSYKDIATYAAKVQKGELATERGLLTSPDDVIRGEVIHRILCHGKVEFKEFEHRYGIEFRKYFASEIAQLPPLAEDSLVELKADSFRLLEVGRLLSRNVAMVFDAYLKKHQELGKPKFSQSI